METKELVNAYLAELENSGCSALTIKGYTVLLSRLEEASLKELPATMVALYRSYKGKAQSTKCKVYSTLNAFADWLLKKQYLSKHPFADERRPKAPDATPRAILDVEMTVLNQKITEQELKYRVAFSLLRDMALRASELVDLNVESFEMSEADPYIRVVGKGKKVRILPMAVDTELYRDLKEYLPTLGRKKGPLFISDRGTRESYRTILRKWHDNITSDYTPHQLRHTQASKIVRAVKNIRVAQELLGHSSVSTTQRYTHTTEEQYKADIRGFLSGQ